MPTEEEWEASGFSRAGFPVIGVPETIRDHPGFDKIVILAISPQFLDGELKTRAYVAGSTYTVADITAMIAVDFMRVSKLTVPDDLVHVRRWHDAVSARPSAKA